MCDCFGNGETCDYATLQLRGCLAILTLGAPIKAQDTRRLGMVPKVAFVPDDEDRRSSRCPVVESCGAQNSATSR